MKSRLSFLIALVVFLGLTAAIGKRIVDHLNVEGDPKLEDHWGWCDFRDAVYFPVKAFLNGENPYALTEYMGQYPVEHNFPLYLPATLVVHLPFGALPYIWSEFLYGAIIVLLTLVSTLFALRLSGRVPGWTSVLFISAALLASRPGYWNLVLGQSTMTAVFGTYIALHGSKSKPWISGMGLTLAMLKPTYGLPLAISMLMRRDFRAVFSGAFISTLLVIAAVIPLVRASGGWDPFLQSLIDTQNYWADIPVVSASAAPFRTDATSVISRLLGGSLSGSAMLMISGAIMGISGWAIHRLYALGVPERDKLSGIIACFAILACFYHQAYDLVVLVFPAIAFLTAPWTLGLLCRPWFRWTMTIAISIVGANHLRAPTLVNRLGLGGFTLGLVETMNGILVLSCWICLCLICLFASRSRSRTIEA